MTLKSTVLISCYYNSRNSSTIFIISLGWPGNASGFPPGRAVGSGWGEGCLGFSAEAAAPANRTRISGWRQRQIIINIECFFSHCFRHFLNSFVASITSSIDHLYAENDKHNNIQFNASFSLYIHSNVMISFPASKKCIFTPTFLQSPSAHTALMSWWLQYDDIYL